MAQSQSTRAVGQPVEAPPSARMKGAHRAPAVRPLSGRVAVFAVAAGAAVTAGSSLAQASSSSQEVRSEAIDLTGDSALLASGPQREAAPQVLQVATPTEEAPAASGISAQNLQVATDLSERREARDLASRRPMVHAPAFGIMTSPFGPRWGSFHGGIDIANVEGTPIYAIADGTVIDSGPASGYGNWIRIRHTNGAISVYGHMSSLDVSAGQKVVSGQKIAGMGNQGFSTGTHLHFEIWPDGHNKVDPAAWLLRYGINVASLSG